MDKKKKKKKKTFRYKCDFCNIIVEIKFEDLKVSFWKLDSHLNSMYKCKCPNCEKKIYITNTMFSFLKLVHKYTPKREAHK